MNIAIIYGRKTDQLMRGSGGGGGIGGGETPPSGGEVGLAVAARVESLAAVIRL